MVKKSFLVQLTTGQGLMYLKEWRTNPEQWTEFPLEAQRFPSAQKAWDRINQSFPRDQNLGVCLVKCQGYVIQMEVGHPLKYLIRKPTPGDISEWGSHQEDAVLFPSAQEAWDLIRETWPEDISKFSVDLLTIKETEEA